MTAFCSGGLFVSRGLAENLEKLLIVALERPLRSRPPGGLGAGRSVPGVEEVRMNPRALHRMGTIPRWSRASGVSAPSNARRPCNRA